MGRVYRIIFRRNTPNRGVLFAEGAFVRKNYEASGCLYLPEEMKDVLTEEELAKIFQKRAAECRNFTVIRYRKNNVEKETLKKLPDETAEDQDRDKEDSDGKTADQQRDEVLNEGQEEEEALLPMEKSDQESYA